MFKLIIYFENPDVYHLYYNEVCLTCGADLKALKDLAVRLEHVINKYKALTLAGKKTEAVFKLVIFLTEPEIYYFYCDEIQLTSNKERIILQIFANKLKLIFKGMAASAREAQENNNV